MTDTIAQKAAEEAVATLSMDWLGSMGPSGLEAEEQAKIIPIIQRAIDQATRERSVLESYLPRMKELSGTKYEIATSGFCEDICNRLRATRELKDETLSLRHTNEWLTQESQELAQLVLDSDSGPHDKFTMDKKARALLSSIGKGVEG